ncbi:hypothetical protein [Clostridium algidicarnis]|uniref:Uncharacterized protein n=1 Tax=Clostridium algidicarnis TaxID=37659 RepID=A0ABS6C3A3_9CLOT|nr:hypothetical protein [Clostridium algidicarnis]MBU3219948.1 hypothetical protein [Clostridium algidicarnis]
MKINDDNLDTLLKTNPHNGTLKSLNLYVNNINGAPLVEMIDNTNFLPEIPMEGYHSKRFKPGD